MNDMLVGILGLAAIAVIVVSLMYEGAENLHERYARWNTWVCGHRSHRHLAHERRGGKTRMNDTLVGVLGLVAIAAIVISLIRGRMLPAMAFILWPSVLALVMVAARRCSFADIETMIKAGFSSTAPTAALFVFSVLFFGIMTDAGMFDVLIQKLMTLMGDNVVGVAMVTAIIALAGQLDGGGASTFCIVIPAMFPVYLRMHMRKTTLLRIAILPMGIMNLLPWAGSTVRTAAVLGIEVSALWRTMLPVQIFGIVLSLVHALLAGFQEKARGAGLHGRLAETEGDIDIGDGNYIFEIRQLKRPKMFAFNVCLTAAVIVLLFWGVFPSYYPFMLGTGIALFVNYGSTAAMHKKIIKRHARPALLMCSVMMGAAVLMGILTSSIGADSQVLSAQVIELPPDAIPSVVRCIAAQISLILPPVLGRHLPLVISLAAVLIGIIFDTDSYFYGLLPILLGIGQAFGTEPLAIAVAMVLCRIAGCFISLMEPATLLGTGLAEVDIKDHIKTCLPYVWAFSFLCILFAIAMGKTAF